MACCRVSRHFLTNLSILSCSKCHNRFAGNKFIYKITTTEFHKRGKLCSSFHSGDSCDFTDKNDTYNFVMSLTNEERQVLFKQLHDFDLEEHGSVAIKDSVTTAQIERVFVVTCLPFIGFGFLDNILMIVAGEYIDLWFGVALGISTMAAAGLGNCLSDIAGIGCSSYVEKFFSRLGIKPPALTAQQSQSGKVRLSSALGKIIGVTIGCLVGMFPLLFFDHRDRTKPLVVESSPATKSG